MADRLDVLEELYGRAGEALCENLPSRLELRGGTWIEDPLADEWAEWAATAVDAVKVWACPEPGCEEFSRGNPPRGQLSTFGKVTLACYIRGHPKAVQVEVITLAEVREALGSGKVEEAAEEALDLLGCVREEYLLDGAAEAVLGAARDAAFSPESEES